MVRLLFKIKTLKHLGTGERREKREGRRGREGEELFLLLDSSCFL
jgi:hypothetical protein